MKCFIIFKNQAWKYLRCYVIQQLQLTFPCHGHNLHNIHSTGKLSWLQLFFITQETAQSRNVNVNYIDSSGALTCNVSIYACNWCMEGYYNPGRGRGEKNGRFQKELSSLQPPSNPKCIFQPFIKMFIIAKSFPNASRLPSMHDQIREKLQVFSLHSTQHKYCHGAGGERGNVEKLERTQMFFIESFVFLNVHSKRDQLDVRERNEPCPSQSCI